MALLLLGLALFLGAHSSRIVASRRRDALIARWGAGRWKGLYSLVSLAGLVLIIVGYGIARGSAEPLWPPPGEWARIVAAVLMLVSLVLVVAGNMPRNAFKARLGHPMLIGIKLWALAHLTANNTLPDVLLFGAFLAWAVAAFAAARRRDRAAGTPAPPSSAVGTWTALAIGVALWGLLLFGGHAWLFGASPAPTLG